MRVDLTQDGNKEIDVELNGKKLENVLWADDVAGECEVFETEWRTGELVKAPDTEWGYRTMRVKGKVKINDRRPKAPASDTVYDFQYPGMCYLYINPSFYPSDTSFVWVVSHPEGAPIQSFSYPYGNLSILEETTVALVDRLKVDHIVIDGSGRGAVLVDTLRIILPDSLSVRSC